MLRAAVVLAALVLCGPARAQSPPLISGAARLRLDLDRLRNTGRVLMIAAHPDDENTSLLAYFSLGRGYQTAYLSLTRGEGGQNLIGSEQGPLLGVIRTQELLAARSTDGAQQYFTRAIDFGFSKTAAETLRKWDRDQALGDIVWVIRRFRPDVIILRFSGTPRDGHGQHQASALLGKEAFTAAADPARFPEQLAHVQPWKARRVLYNHLSFTPQMERDAEAVPNKIVIDTGEFNPLFGYSYGEIAAISRSRHSSQGMGTALRRGSQRNILTVVAGDPATQDPFEGIDTSWNRVPGGAAVAAALDDASRAFDPRAPTRILPALFRARAAMEKQDEERRAVDELIAAAAGLWLDASAANFAVKPGSGLEVNVTAVLRSTVEAKLAAVSAGDVTGSAAPLERNVPATQRMVLTVPKDAPVSQPYWLRAAPVGSLYDVPRLLDRGRPESPPLWEARFRLALEGGEIEIVRPVLHRYVDRARGELTRAVVVTPPAGISGMQTLAYDHIPRQVLLPLPKVSLAGVDAKSLARRIGYVMGVGDQMPEALREAGLDVTLLSASDLASSDLARYDAIVTGVCAWISRPDLPASRPRLLDFVANGGTLIDQYNGLSPGPCGGRAETLVLGGPFPLSIGAARITEEDAPLVAISAGHPLLQGPNRITGADYAGWVQERGLYLAASWDARYQPVWESNDQGEPPQRGLALYARHGKGVYIFTSLAFFRQLPAGVPGAYRIFANMLSAARQADQP